MKEYIKGYKLEEDEYLLKIREKDKVGFLTKLTQKGEIPKAFADWEFHAHYGRLPEAEKFPIYVFKEEFRKGWKLNKWRFGMSQNWASVIHPEGFSVEIYLSQFLDIVKTSTVVNGEIQGRFKWCENKLIKEELELNN